ncbi:hypothetical protein E2C01_044670 [Portunus trituberculatus]|uniref:Uncharacterized protein n=1 Tax=Portunus trituberculatus TaxID=210409 RepID=A0A5B7FYZ6_PORTR|nr:hypothetical protein [Portunus trituberculatus]
MLKIRISVSKKAVVEITVPVPAADEERQASPIVTVVTEGQPHSAPETRGQRLLHVPKEVSKQPSHITEDTGKKTRNSVCQEPLRLSSSRDSNQIPCQAPPTTTILTGHHCIYNCPTACPTCWKATRRGEHYVPCCVCKIAQPKSSMRTEKKLYRDTYFIVSIFLLLLGAACVGVWRWRGAV